MYNIDFISMVAKNALESIEARKEAAPNGIGHDGISLKEIEFVILIGIGASISNTKAISGFAKCDKQIIYIDSLETELIDSCLHGKSSKNTVIVAISKSGTTDETKKILDYILRQKLKDPICYVVTENNRSALFRTGLLSKNCEFIEYEPSQSGRFSIFQNASYVAPILAGAKSAELFKDFPLSTAYAELGDILLGHYEANRRVLVISIYNRKLIGFAEWIRQMISESLGKNKFGITPIISIGSVDEHSQLQLYLDGPDDKIYYILPYIEGENEEFSKDQALHYAAFQKALARANRPMIIEKESGFSLIAKWINLIQYIAGAKGLNPYDQLAVDEAKTLFLK